MIRLALNAALLFVVGLAFAVSVQAQTTTYHLHSEGSSTSGLFQLKTAQPDAPSSAAQSINLKNHAAGEYIVKAFDTQTGVPNVSGVIPAGSPITLTLWMKKTGTAGTMFPRAKLNLNGATGTSICVVTGSIALTTTLTQYTLNGTAGAAISMTTADRFYLWVGVNLTTAIGNSNINAELDIEGTFNGNYDSQISVPQTAPPPTISGLSPTSGPAGTPVTVSGNNFGATQGTSAITFNGVAATPTSWNSTSIETPVPGSATTGPVVVTAGGAPSNGVNFTVITTGTISGTITRASDATAVSGALVEAVQANVVKASATSGTDGTYSIAAVTAGTYDIRVSASGYGTAVSAGIIATAGGTVTANVSLSAPGSISGNVTKSDGGTAIAGAVVKVNLGATTLGSATTNGTGDYTVSSLGPGTFAVQASAPGYAPRILAGVSVTSGATTTVNLSLADAAIIYVYDELGRLIAVTDPASDTAVYAYDAVGNLLSISRQPSSQVSIIKFTPNSGQIGASVIIYGTGFSEVASENTVKFSGVTAAVIAASAAQITTSVPVGATSGPISVTAPTGSSTSSATFTVTTPVGPPTISGFTPTIGSAGTTVTLTGTNFDTTAGNNQLTFNISRSWASSANATAIVTSVPTRTGSGRISVTTPGGAAVSSGDFFIPPELLTAADIEFTGRIAPGETKNPATSTLGKKALIVFDGVSGQRISLSISAGLFVYIYKPDGTNLFPRTYTSFGLFIDTITLSVAGTYTVLMDPIDPGSMSISLSNVPADITGSITIGGPPVTVTMASAGQNASLTFSGTSGQRVTLQLSNVTISHSYVSIYKADGTQLISTDFNINGGVLGPVVLPADGTYTILADPDSSTTGSMTLTLYDAPADITGTITPGGSPVAITITTPGQNATLTFNGNAAQRISLALTGASSPVSQVSIKKPDGTYLFSPTFFGTGGGFIDSISLAVNGTYTIVIDPFGAATGSITVTLYDVPSDAIGTTTIGGTAADLTTTVPGQNAKATFDGASAQQVTVHITNNTMNTVTVKLLKPDGSTLTSLTSSSASFNLASQILSVAGTYTVSIDPSGTSTGSISVSVTSP